MSQITNNSLNQPRSTLSPHVRPVLLDFCLGIVTLLLWNVWVQYKQIQAANEILGEKKFSFLWWNIGMLLTLGLYLPYHEARLSFYLGRKLKQWPYEPLLAVILSLLGLNIVCDAIRQMHINRYFEQP